MNNNTVQIWPNNFKLEIAPRVFYRKYPVSVRLELPMWQPSFKRQRYVMKYEQRRALEDKQRIELNKATVIFKDQKYENTRTMFQWWGSNSFYFESYDDAAEFLTLIKHLDIFAVVRILPPKMAETSKLDAKLEFRKQKYYQKYTWRIDCGKGQDLTETLMGIFGTEDTENDKFKLTNGGTYYNTIVYLDDEDDAVLVKIAASQVKSIRKAIVVE